MFIQLTNKIEQFIQQQQQQPIESENKTMELSQINVHIEQLAEFTNLIDEYRQLQEENHFLKQHVKQNIEAIYMLNHH